MLVYQRVCPIHLEFVESQTFEQHHLIRPKENDMWFWMIPWVVFFPPNYRNLWTRIPIPHLKACERTINDVPLLSTNMALFGIWVPCRFFCITVWLVIVCYYVMRPCWIILMIFEISPMFEQTQANIQWEKRSGTVTVHAMTIYPFAVKQWVIPLLINQPVEKGHHASPMREQTESPAEFDDRI